MVYQTLNSNIIDNMFPFNYLMIFNPQKYISF